MTEILMEMSEVNPDALLVILFFFWGVPLMISFITIINLLTKSYHVLIKKYLDYKHPDPKYMETKKTDIREQGTFCGISVGVKDTLPDKRIPEHINQALQSRDSFKNYWFRYSRCCTCPNSNTPWKTLCPPGEGFFPKEEHNCAFVRTFQDEKGAIISVSQKDSSWFVGRRKHFNSEPRQIKSASLPICNCFDEAQINLNIYAQAKDWHIYQEHE